MMDGLSVPVPHDAENLHPPEVQLAAALLAGTSALVTGPDGTGAALLRAVAAHLASSRIRVLRVGPPLDLPGFLDQVTRAGGAAGDTVLEQGFAALTDLGPSCDRIALLVEDAHLVPDATLRYIEFALHAGPHLCIAFAGQPGIAGTLGLPGYAGLRKRLSLRLVLPSPQPVAPMAAPPAAAAAASPANTMPVRRRAIRVWRELAGAALAAGIAVLLWTHLVPLRGTGTTAGVQAQPAGPSPASGVRLTTTYTATGDVAGVEAAEPALPATQRAATAVSPVADLDPAPPGTLANLPPAPEPTAPAVPQAAGPDPAMATTEPPAAIPASRIPDTTPNLPRPVLADAPAAVPPVASSQDGPMMGATAGLLPEPSAPEPSAPEPPVQAPVVQAALQSGRPPVVPGQDGPIEAAIAGLRPEPTVPPPGPSLPGPAVQAAPQVAGPPAVPSQDGLMPAAIAGLPHEPPAAAAMPPPPAPVVQAAPQDAGPLAAPGHDGPAAAAIAGPQPASSQPATDLVVAPQAAGRRTVPALRDPSTIQTAARAPNLRRLPPRAAAIPAEQAAARSAGPGLGYCRGIVLRAQLGEELTYGDRIFMRNGCR
jgi:hypothetical protein